jgi:hypothetical protein
VIVGDGIKTHRARRSDIGVPFEKENKP